MNSPELFTVIGTIEQPGFFARTGIASTHGAVSSILSRTSEIQVLCEQKEKSVPLLIDRYRTNTGNMSEHMRLTYFVLFGLLRDRRTKDLIIAYLQACRKVPGEEMLSPWHPFLHAVRALSLISDGQILVPKTNELILGIEKFLERVEAWNTQDEMGDDTDRSGCRV